LQKDGIIHFPLSANNIDTSTNVITKLLYPEYDVCDAWNSRLEITWENVPEDATLLMRAMEEDLGPDHGGPIYYPRGIHTGQTLSHTLVNDGGIIVDGLLQESSKPDFSVFWEPDTPHPDGYTYGWLHSDNEFFYAAVEVTGDNTPDEEDWGAIYVMVDGELREFRVSPMDASWGAVGFGYTLSVPYEHRTYEFRIPLGEIDATAGYDIQYGFGSYGTVAETYITIEKSTNGEDADLPPGPVIAVGDPVTWTYQVNNISDVTISDILVTDDQGVVVTCPRITLGPGESMICTASGTAVLGQYENLGSVTASDPAGNPVSDHDPSHYYSSVAYDFGDAPDPTYPTLLASDGARHIIVPGLSLGSVIDNENDGQPNLNATGDDSTGDADEDGITFTTPLVPGQLASIDVSSLIPAGAIGFLHAWIDFNADGDWNDASEQIFASHVLTGADTLNFDVPSEAAIGETFARFRLSWNGSLAPNGLTSSGEVEDYLVAILVPTTSSIGDTVFYDDNGNGTQNPVEDGIAGVTVELYMDDGDGVFDIETSDTLKDMKITGGAGSYLFSDLEPFCDQGYWVLVVESTLPPGVLLTTGNNPFGPICLEADEFYSVADFGYLRPYYGAVGGEAHPVNRVGLIAPWIVLALLLLGCMSYLSLRHRAKI